MREETGRYKCFGCQAAGDVFTFVQEIEHLDFVGAVETLANRAGIQLRYTNQNEGEHRRKRAELTDAVEAAVARQADVLLVDTAGRLAIDDARLHDVDDEESEQDRGQRRARAQPPERRPNAEQ